MPNHTEPSPAWRRAIRYGAVWFAAATLASLLMATDYQYAGIPISLGRAFGLGPRTAMLIGAGIETPIGCHTFRGTGITNFLENGGKLEDAQTMAGHSSAKTTKLYDRRERKIQRGEVEKITIL